MWACSPQHNLAYLTELTKSSDTLKVYLKVNNSPYIQVKSPELHVCHKIHPQDPMVDM